MQWNNGKAVVALKRAIFLPSPEPYIENTESNVVSWGAQKPGNPTEHCCATHAAPGPNGPQSGPPINPQE